MSPSAATAIEKLESSQLDQSQLELAREMSDDDIDAVVLSIGGKMGFNLRPVLEDIMIERTMEGASTVTITVMDYDRDILRNGNLKAKQDVNLDGLWFRLAGINKQDNSMDLIFEEREIAVLRTYDKRLGPIERSQITRAEFILRMIKEPKEIHIKYVIPELHKVQPIEKGEQVPGTGGTSRTGGIPEDAGGTPSDSRHHPDVTSELNLTVKGEPASPEQIRNANIVLQVGESMGARRKVLVAAIMTIIQEATMRNLEGGDRDSVGLFQQRASWGSYTDRHDPATAARLFYIEAIKVDKERPKIAYYELCQAVQRSAYPNAYAQWRTEGERFVTAYGVAGGDTKAAGGDLKAAFQASLAQTSDGAYYFYRGHPPTQGGAPWKKEDSWSCIQRLSDEVDWRAFFVSGTFYYMDEEMLFRSKPRMILSEDTEGVGHINFNYNTNKKEATITFTVNVARWGAPPGSVIQLNGMGPANGRWLVQTIRRSLFSPYATVTIAKPRPELPEPFGSNLPSDNTISGQTKNPGNYKVGTAVVQPIPKGQGAPTKDQPTHNTLGGVDPRTGRPSATPAIDFMAKPGSDVVAPVGGTIIKISGHPTSEGAVEGAGGPFGRTIYILTPGGSVVMMTHLGDDVNVAVGQHVDAGDTVGTVGDYPGGTPDHVHIGVITGGDGLTVHDIANAPQAVPG